MELNGSSAIVTGGASGLGLATSRLLAERGVRVVVADVQEDKGVPWPRRSAACSCRPTSPTPSR